MRRRDGGQDLHSRGASPTNAVSVTATMLTEFYPDRFGLTGVDKTL